MSSVVCKVTYYVNENGFGVFHIEDYTGEIDREQLEDGYKMNFKEAKEYGHAYYRMAHFSGTPAWMLHPAECLPDQGWDD